MTIIGSQTLSIMTEPSVDDIVLGYGEEEIAFTVELDLVEGPFVAGEEDWALWKSEEMSRKRRM